MAPRNTKACKEWMVLELNTTWGYVYLLNLSLQEDNKV